MTDYVVSVGLETRVGNAMQDVGGVAGAIDKLGSSATVVAGGVTKLEQATDGLTLAHRRAAMEQRRVADAERELQRVRASGRTGLQADLRAQERLLVAQERLAVATVRARRAQETAGPAAGAGGLSLARGVAALASYETARFAIQSVSQVQQANVSLTALLGSEKKAQDLIGQLQTFARQTPFNFSQLLNISQQFVAMGVPAKELMPEITAIADAVGAMGGNSEQLTAVALALSQIRNSSKVNAQDLRQLVESGHLPVFDILSKANNMSRKELQDQINAGQFNLDGQLAAQQILDGLEERFHGGAERAAKTLSGQLSNLYDNAQQAAAKTLKPFLPELTFAVRELGDTIGFVAGNETTRHLIELSAGAYVAKKAVDAVGTARVFLFGQTARTVASNALIARSYDGVAGAAARAAAAETAAAGGGGGGLVGRVAGSALFAAARTPAGVVTIGAGVSALNQFSAARELARRNAENRDAIEQAQSIEETKKLIASLDASAKHLMSKDAGVLQLGKQFFGARDPYEVGVNDAARADEAREKLRQQEAELQAIRNAAKSSDPYVRAQGVVRRTEGRVAAAAIDVKDAHAYLESRSYVKDAANVPLGGLLDALPDKPDASLLMNARDERKAAVAALAIAEARVKAARAGAGAGGAGRGQIAAAEAAVLTAQDAVRKRGGNPEAEALRLEAAEARLAKAKQGGKADTVALMTAEKGLEDARVRQRKANEDLHKAEKEASGDKSVSLRDVLARASHTAKTSTSEVANVRALVKAGLSEPVIAELEKLEQTAPGTIAKVAKGITPAFVKQLNADQAARDKATIDLARLGGEAKLKTAQTEAAAAGTSLAEAQKKAYLAALKDPAWQDEARREFAGILLPEGTGAPDEAGQPKGKHADPQPKSNDEFYERQGGQPVGVTAGVVVAPIVVVAPTRAPAGGPTITPTTKNYHIHQPTIVAGNVEKFNAELEKQERLAALG